MAAADPMSHGPGDGAPQQAGRRWWTGFVRRKHHIGFGQLMVLAVAACIPLAIALLRILAMPWGDSLPLEGISGIGHLRELGATLNREFTLEWIPPSDRSSVLYLMLLPTGALLITIARLTLGLRVLGLRAVLIAIGFQAIGILPSMALMLFVIGLILVVRPWMRRARLPMYARIPVILCLSSLVMVGALVLAPWLGSDALWSVAFFPVVIMAMLAESVARTLEKDDGVMALWRAGWTVLLALLISFMAGAVSRFMFSFPELILTELVAVIWIAEFLDLRLLEAWPARISRYLSGERPWFTPRPKVAVVRNRDPGNVIAALGPATPQDVLDRSVQRDVDALRDEGFEVKVVEGDMKLPKTLAEYLPPDAAKGTPGGIVLNLAMGLQGHGRHSHVPAMLEMCGLPYTGPDPVGMAQLSDRFALWTLLGRAGIPVPRHFLVAEPDPLPDVEFPAVVRPRTDPEAPLIVVRRQRELVPALRAVLASQVENGGADASRQAVVEQLLAGRRFTVGLLGNGAELECLPVLERGERGGWEPPADLPEELAAAIRTTATAAFRSSGLRDYGRIDLRLNDFDEPVVVEARWSDLFARQGAFRTAAALLGYSHGALLRRIVGEAARRYVGATGGGTTAARAAAAALQQQPNVRS